MTNKLTLIFKMIDTASLKLDLLIKKKNGIEHFKNISDANHSGRSSPSLARGPVFASYCPCEMSHIGMPTISEALSSFHAHCLIPLSFNCIKSQSPNYLRLVSQIRAGCKSQKRPPRGKNKTK